LRLVPGFADARVQQAFQKPSLRVAFDRTFGSLVGLTIQNASTTMQQSLAGSSQTIDRQDAPALAIGIPERRLLRFAASDEIRLEVWFSGADGYAAQNQTGMWGHLLD
jgi:Cu/Ag efflux pump CusA